MLKHINHQNFLTTPFVAVKKWDLNNVQNDDVVLIEQTPDLPVAVEYIDYSGAPVINIDCNIALEQQDPDELVYQEGITGSGIFYPDTEDQNADGTYKRIVHAQTKASFYNNYRNPTQIFGVEHIDFPLSRTERHLSDEFRMFNIPRRYFGESLVEYSIQLYDTALDDTVDIHDDGYQNLHAGFNLFSKVQEIRGYPHPFVNIVLPGTASCSCSVYTPPGLPDSSSYSSASGVFDFGLHGGSIVYSTSTVSGSDDIRNSPLGAGNVNVGILHGNLDSPAPPIGVSNFSFGLQTGSIVYTILTLTGSNDSSSMNLGLQTGSIVYTLLTLTGSNDSSSMNLGLQTGSCHYTVLPLSNQSNASTVNVGFTGGSLA